MWPDRVSTLGPLAHESVALPTGLLGAALDPRQTPHFAGYDLGLHCLLRYILFMNTRHECVFNYGMLNVALFDIFTLLFYLIY